MSHWPWEDWIEVRVENCKIWETTPEGLRKNMGVNQEVLDWLVEHVGPKHTIRQNGTWRYSLPIADKFTLFWFEDPDQAMLFKLTWG